MRRWRVLVVVLLAFALRVWQLGGHSLRGDEAFDVVFVRLPLSRMVVELCHRQPYPPAFHLFFRCWVAGMGESEVALRFPAMWFGVLMVPLAFGLGKSWFGERAALWGALLVAWGPLAVWYAQDGRMYAPLMALTMASLYLAARLWRGDGGRWLWGGYVAVTFLGLMCHYMAFLSLAAQQVCALVAWRQQGGRWGRRWLVAQMVVVALCLPWLAMAWPLLRSHTSSWVQPASLPEVVARTWRAVTVGLTLSWHLAWGPMAAAGLAFVLALWRGNGWQVRFFALASTAVPVALISVGSLWRPMFDERYVVGIVAPALVVVGAGIDALGRWGKGRWWKWGAAGVLLGGMWGSYLHYRIDPSCAKSPPWRALFAYLATHVRDGDVMVYTYPDPAAEVYTAGRWPVVLLPPSYPPDRRDVSVRVARLAASYDRIWLLPQWSPQWDEWGLTEELLDGACERAAELRVASWSLILYHTPRLYRREFHPLDALLAGEIRLVGYALRDAGGEAVERVVVQPGGEVRLTLYWRAESPLQQDYVVFVHLLDGGGVLRGQQDGQPRRGRFPTRAWRPGELVVDEYRVSLPADAPTGEYVVEVGMYRPADGTRLEVTGAGADPGERRVLLKGLIEVRGEE